MAATRPTIGLILMTLLLGACNNTPPPRPARIDPVLLESYPRIYFQGELYDRLAYAAPIVVSSIDKPMKVTVPLRVTTKDQLNVQYRFEFYDADGVPLQPKQEGWRFIHLPQMARHYIQTSAMDTTAVDWRLVIRPAY